MKPFLFIIPLILVSSLIAKAGSTECQTKLNNTRDAMNVISSNIANLNTTRTSEGGPYQRQELICTDNGCEIIKNQKFISKLEPAHPDADEYGYVEYPDIKLMDEMSNLIDLTRDYEEIVASCT